AERQIAVGDLPPPGFTDPRRQRSLVRPVADRLVQIVVGVGIGAHRLGDDREYAVVVEAVETRERARRRMRELAHDESSPGARDAQQLAEGYAGLVDIA